MTLKENRKKTIFIASSISEWGGSEELWSKTVPYLLEKGYHIVVCRPYILRSHPKIVQLANQGVEFLPTHSLPKKPSAVRRYEHVIGRLRQLFNIKVAPSPIDKHQFDQPAEVLLFDKTWFVQYLKSYDPQLVLISQGGNFDGLIYGVACMELDVPYVIVSHKTVDFYWPPPIYRNGMRAVYTNARQCYFVSQHTKRFTEEQFGVRLPKSQVIFNPVKLKDYIPYPDTNAVFQLCCMGRLDLVQKGQDILVRALSHEKWKNRPVKVLIIGSGPDENALKELVSLLKVQQIVFQGEVDDIDEVWRQSHALVLPSRAEGLPLVIVEAMMAGRPVITTDVGGNKEFLEEGITGFIGDASDASFEATLERAWQHRESWKKMGDHATRSIRTRIPELPEQVFADLLASHINE